MTMSMVIGTFLIFWLPSTIASFVFAVLKDREYNVHILDAFIILAQFNSAVDPIIYAYRNKSVRNAIKIFLKCGRR